MRYFIFKIPQSATISLDGLSTGNDVCLPRASTEMVAHCHRGPGFFSYSLLMLSAPVAIKRPFLVMRAPKYQCHEAAIVLAAVMLWRPSALLTMDSFGVVITVLVVLFLRELSAWCFRSSRPSPRGTNSENTNRECIAGSKTLEDPERASDGETVQDKGEIESNVAASDASLCSSSAVTQSEPSSGR